MTASAQPVESTGPRDRFDLWVHGETNAILFQRSLLPGPRGSLVRTETVAPIRQDIRVRARDLDTSWRKDSIDVELSAWATALPGDDRAPRPVDGDVQTANVGYEHGPVEVRLGRQHAAGAAARYARFDGLDIRAKLGSGLEADAYGGFRVLPRWNLRPGYYELGAPSSSALRAPDALPDAERSDYWLAGGRLGWEAERASIALSFHEQRQDGGIGRRNLGATARAEPLDSTTVGGKALVEMDSRRLADGRAWVDIAPLPEVDLSVEYFHTNPALLLSRQSVLSVFSTAAYDEAGGTVAARPLDFFTIEGAGWVQFYETGHPGARGDLIARIVAPRSRKTQFRLAYSRVLAPDNGYHALRASLSRRVIPQLLATFEAYGYFYDEAIRSVRTSSVYAGTLTWQARSPFSLLAGASLARSPYATVDAQTQLRAAYDFDFSTRGPLQ